MKNTLIKLFGLEFVALFSGPAGFDRWIWLKKNLMLGELKTLDAGCGSGTFTLYAGKIGNKALGISFDRSNIDTAKERAQIMNIRNADFLKWDLRELSKIISDIGLFDQVICFETIEHIMDDKQLIADLSALLKPGGRILLTTPYKYYNHLLGDKLSTFEDGGHVRWGYTFKEIEDLFSKNGLEVIAEEYITGVISQQICNLERLLGKLLGGYAAWVLSFPFRVFQCLDNHLTKMFNYPYLTIGMIGIKRSKEISCFKT